MASNITDYTWIHAYDNTGNTGSTFPVTIPVGATAILIAVMHSTGGAGVPTTVSCTFDGVTAPLIPGASVTRSISGTGYQRIDVFRVFNPTTGVSKNIVFNTDKASPRVMLVAPISGGYTDTDGNAWGTVVTGTFGAGASPSVTVSSAVNDEVIDFCNSSWPNTDTLAVGAGQTDKANFGDGSGGSGFRGTGSREDGAASVTMSWTKTGGNSGTAQLAIPIKAQPTGVTVTISSGVSAATAVGTVSTSIQSPVTVTGVSSTAAVYSGPVAIDVTVHVDSVPIPADVGNPVAQVPGIVVVTIQTGVSTTVAVGQLKYASSLTLSGLVAQTQVGVVGIGIDSNLLVPITGVSASAQVGSINVSLTTNSVTLSAGVGINVAVGRVTVNTESPLLSLIVASDTQPAFDIISSQTMNDIPLNNNLEFGWLISIRDPATGLPIPATGLSGVQSWISATIGGPPIDPSVSIILSERVEQPGAYFGLIDGSIVTAVLGADPGGVRTFPDGSKVYLVLGVGNTINGSEQMYVRDNRIIQAA